MLTVVIQAGGESHRMGEDKALRPFLGRPLVERVLARVRPIADELFVIANRQPAYRFLNCPLYADLLPGRGPLGGLYTALSVAAGDCVAVVGCDMPFVNARLLRHQYELLGDAGADAVVPRSTDGWEPLHAVYRRATCLPTVSAALDTGIWRMSAWLDSVRVRPLAQNEWLAYDPLLRAFCNVNTPQEFAQAERWATADGSEGERR